jgi:fructosamine-3-kinase
VVDVICYSGDFDRVYVVLHYLMEGEFSKHRWSFFGEWAAVCHEMPGRLFSLFGAAT